MEEKRITILSISDLIHRGRPVAAASSLFPTSTSKHLRNDKISNTSHCHRSSISINSQTLKPLNHSALLIGILTLPSFANSASPVKCTCFQFSDDSASICCDILDFNPQMIDKKVRILAWNFVPLKCDVKGGFLEIITWDFFYPCSGNSCSFSDFNGFCLSLGACDVKDSFKASCLIFGVIESISPLFLVPCATGGSGSRNINGFLVSILICQCKNCASRYILRDLNVKNHCFTKSVIAYFCGLASSWHPVMSKFIGDVALLMGLKKKLVFLRKEESQLMYVTTDEVSLHTKMFKEHHLNHDDTNMRGKGESGSYTGFVTGSYMQGMILELDQQVMLLSTHQHLSFPHSIRVGALVTLKNVHFVDPKFPWGKMFILDACCRTSAHVESFSPLESWCQLKSHSPSRLQKFIDSLSSGAKFWSLLVVSCFRKKFAGIFSLKEILGSKHKEGLAQKYARLHLPSSAFQTWKHGVLLEFCRHDLCFSGKEVNYRHLRLVVPIANLVSYCEASWKEVLKEHENDSDFKGAMIQNDPQWCSGRTYVKSIKRVLCSEEIGVLVLGTLKICLSTGRLQLVDATGAVDIVLDLPSTWDSEKIFEAKDFRIIIEGIPPKLVDMDSTILQPLSCQSLFSNALPLGRLTKSIYLYHCPSVENSESRSHFFHRRGDPLDFDNGRCHLLMLTHKFPIMQKFLGDLQDRSNMFAEAIVLPWYLLVAGKHRDSVVCSGHCEDRPQKHRTHKRCKGEQTSAEVSSYSWNDAENTSVTNNRLELPFLTAGKCVNSYWKGMLHSTDEFISGCKLPRRKILLEFGLDSFCKYEALKIGGCVLVKHQEEGLKLCNTKENSCAKVFISSGTHISSLTFSSVECLQSANMLDDELIIPKGCCWEYEYPCLIGNSKIYSDVDIFVPSGALNPVENIIKMVCIPDEPRDDGGSLQSAVTLPEGNLVTLQGIVLAFHDCEGVPAFPGEEHAGVCLHVLADNHIVTIFCNLSKESYPVELGRDVYATFHRILQLSEANKYMMAPVSFITVDRTSLMCGNFSHASGTHSVASPKTFPTSLISNALQSSQLKPMQFRCRVVALYILVLEKTATSKSLLQSPFAGFIMDDASGSCCCWVESAVFLGLESQKYLLQVLEQHGRIVVKNYGDMFDPSCHDLTFCVESAERILSTCDEFVLGSLISSPALFTTSWSVVGSVMDEESRRRLEERLSELEVGLPPLLNIWATTVSPQDHNMRAHATNLINACI